MGCSPARLIIDCGLDPASGAGVVATMKTLCKGIFTLINIIDAILKSRTIDDRGAGAEGGASTVKKVGLKQESLPAVSYFPL